MSGGRRRQRLERQLRTARATPDAVNMDAYAELADQAGRLRAADGPTLVCVDVETTGTRPEAGDQIIELGALAVDPVTLERTGPTLDLRVCPQVPVTAEAAAVNGYTPAAWSSAPGQAEARRMAREWFAARGEYTLVGHNIQFDARFLAMWGIASRRVVDTASLVWPLQLRGELADRSLDAVCARLGIDRPVPHRAFADAVAAWQVARAMSRLRL